MKFAHAFLLVLGAVLTIASAPVVYHVADKEPFRGYSRAELNHEMLLPVAIIGLWLIGCISALWLIVLQKISPFWALWIL